ncbi:uncharacterized protein BXIN_0689 [Babesia sp. Xinjiang]|uniref:uncharacterized protein n=1 Tax=Babesia sp. Xinjiang TaxID=462227 RepID=UPI000A24C075|nr:uncharacterized protein BXIN_0710 [Babesia sp. Xinjiang]XP_028872596.1 uncharacterized protein BXIN_0689 [Babesia sp. Xinjiang]ORM42109.1 hypothetical protein BXIN_0710 [Babesia sp. Xinjiang]ORM42140.1 hypothetical protein BXIN_0689 [Babesia sp. Xinjiang]
MIGLKKYIFWFVLLAVGIGGDPVKVKLPSDRFHYDRSKAKGPLIRGSIVTRAQTRPYTPPDDKPNKIDEAEAVGKTVPEGHGTVDAQAKAYKAPEPVKESPPMCKVKSFYPYNKSPVIEIKGIDGLFNSILVGYQDPESSTRENKGSVFGWSTTIDSVLGRRVPFTFNFNYAPITPILHPTSYCALIIQPPFEVNSHALRAFTLPPRHIGRSLESTEGFEKYLKDKKSKVVTSCCFVVHPRHTVEGTSKVKRPAASSAES